MPKDTVVAALTSMKRRKGKLLPQDVVAAAKPPKSPLHDCFEWDDSAAAHRYRLWQARELIVSVRVEEGAGPAEQVFYSLACDRHDGGGYRDIRDIVSHKALREELIRTAAAELATFRDRYERVRRYLPGVFKAIDQLQQRVNGNGKGHAAPSRRELATASK